MELVFCYMKTLRKKHETQAKFMISTFSEENICIMFVLCEIECAPIDVIVL